MVFMTNTLVNPHICTLQKGSPRVCVAFYNLQSSYKRLSRLVLTIVQNKKRANVPILPKGKSLEFVCFVKGA